MNRNRVAMSALIAACALIVGVTATSAEAATPTAVYVSVDPSRPMANEQFTASWHLSTNLNRDVRLQTTSAGTWKTITERISNNGDVDFTVHSSKTRDYRVYVPKTTRAGKAYPSFSSKAKTLRIFPQTVDAFATPYEQCGTPGENVPVTLVAQFEPRRQGRTVTFTSADGFHPTVTGMTDSAGNVAVQVPAPTFTNGDFSTTVTAASFRGSATKSVVITYRTVENLCSWFH